MSQAPKEAVSLLILQSTVSPYTVPYLQNALVKAEEDLEKVTKERDEKHAVQRRVNHQVRILETAHSEQVRSVAELQALLKEVTSHGQEEQEQGSSGP